MKSSFIADLQNGLAAEDEFIAILNHAMGDSSAFTKNELERAPDIIHISGKTIEVKCDYSQRAARNNGLQIYFQVQTEKCSGAIAGPYEALYKSCPYFVKMFRAKGFPHREFIFRTSEFIKRFETVRQNEPGCVRPQSCRGHKKVFNVPISRFVDLAMTVDELCQEISTTYKVL